jgi:short-subunit dehydrogenase
VNLRGVVHGVVAAYPQMIKQGHGHIVNTASMGGLTAAGQICPAAVETPLLDKGSMGAFSGRDYYPEGQGIKTPYDADRLARDTLGAIERNKALLVKPRRAHAAWLLARLAPGVMQRMSIKFVARQRDMQSRSSVDLS